MNVRLSSMHGLESHELPPFSRIRDVQKKLWDPKPCESKITLAVGRFRYLNGVVEVGKDNDDFYEKIRKLNEQNAISGNSMNQETSKKLEVHPSPKKFSEYLTEH